MTEIIGKRVYADADGHFRLSPGDYGLNPHDGKWYCRVPESDSVMGNLGGHEVVEHEDGTITVSPSILISDSNGVQWHGYLESGIWRSI